MPCRTPDGGTAKTMSASGKSNSRPVSGNHTLYTASLALNSNRSQATEGTAARSCGIRARSSCSDTASGMPAGSGRSGSASMPSAAVCRTRATAAAR